MAMETSLQDTTTLIGSSCLTRQLCKSIHFITGNPEADGSFEVNHIHCLKEILGHDMRSQLIFIHAIDGSEQTWDFR